MQRLILLTTPPSSSRLTMTARQNTRTTGTCRCSRLLFSRSSTTHVRVVVSMMMVDDRCRQIQQQPTTKYGYPQKNRQDTLVKTLIQQQQYQQEQRQFHSSMAAAMAKDTSSNPNNKKNKKKTHPSGSAAAGRIVVHEQKERGSSSKKKKKTVSSISRPKMCVGCGTEVVVSSGGVEDYGMTAGPDAVADVGSTRSKKQAKKTRYVDPTDHDTMNSSYLCQRCQALQSDNVWQAYDALRDVSPKVFFDQLKYIVSRRRFGLCVLVVDATDPEHTNIRNLRKAIGTTPIILVMNKIDLLPRMNDRDERFLVSRLQERGTRYIESYSVSAETGAGLVELAEGVLKILGGRDVFVVGAANVGKSSLVKRLSALIATNVRFRGMARQAVKRRDAITSSKLQVTGSNLPGTTLQAVRVPCFPSRNHALWDTPGIINARAVQYHLFPSHLMLPLTRPEAIPIPTNENGLAWDVPLGFSILVEATWMAGPDDDDDDNEDKGEPCEEHPCVLGRVDILGDGDNETKARTRPTIFAQAYLHPSLRVRVVPTKDAPSIATVPEAYIEKVKGRIQDATGRHETGLSDHYSLPLKPFVTKERPKGEMTPFENEYTGQIRMDIVFASLGWIAFKDEYPFAVVPHCVQGSVFSMRRSLYPVNVRSLLDENDTLEQQHVSTNVDLDDQEIGRSLRDAVREGRQHYARGSSTSNEETYDDGWY